MGDEAHGAQVAKQLAESFLSKKLVEDIHKKYVIDQVEFGVMSGEEITKYSALEIHNRELYDHTTRAPFVHGCLDPRLGVSNKGGVCSTCKQSVQDCTGHFGFVRLVLPVFHVGYFKHTIAILTCLCKTCGRLLFDQEDRERFLKRMRQVKNDALSKKLLFRKIVEEARTLTECPHCQAVNGPVRKVIGQPLKIYHEVNPKKLANAHTDQYRLFIHKSEHENSSSSLYSGRMQEDMHPLRVKWLLDQCPPEDWEVIDIIQPSRLLLTHVIVPPVSIRPSVLMGDSGSTEDDITVKLSEIVYSNKLLRSLIEKGAATKQIWDNWDFLALQCALLINADMPGIPAGIVTKPIRGICQRLKGKEGRFRGNLSGKRVDFSGRTVISPDPNLRIDEVAVPMWMAKRLTFPEEVNQTNIERLRKAVVNGSNEWPGALFINKKEGNKCMLRYGNRRQLSRELEIGDVVERHLNNGDVVLFNRQPSLHRMSIMAHRARVMPWRTLRFNECVCQPYNADFDGDEMNIHVPQTQEARAEALHLMGVVNNLVTPKNGEPLIACTQDFLTGSYLMTQRDCFLTRSQMTTCCAYFSDGLVRITLPPPAVMKPLELWTGKQLFSMILRPNESSKVCVNLEIKEREFSGCSPAFMCESDGYVMFQNSELISGCPGKATLGGSKDGLIYRLIRDNSSDAAATMMNRIAKVTSRWLMHQGMTIGIDDVTPGDKLMGEKRKLLNGGFDRVEEFQAQYKLGTLPIRSGCTVEESLELLVKGCLDELRDGAGRVCKRVLKRTNKPLMMFLCGSKGQLINTAQMIACVGQQNVGGKRIHNGFVERTLPHFEKGSRDAGANGFVGNSFFSGLTPTEFFFHTMSGREGLVDTAVKTAETGYMQRRLIKALEDLATGYDLSVRTSSGNVVQFVYGDDGISPAMLEGKDTPVDFNHVWKHVVALVTSQRHEYLYKVGMEKEKEMKELQEAEEKEKEREREKEKEEKKAKRGRKVGKKKEESEEEEEERVEKKAKKEEADDWEGWEGLFVDLSKLTEFEKAERLPLLPPVNFVLLRRMVAYLLDGTLNKAAFEKRIEKLPKKIQSVLRRVYENIPETLIPKLRSIECKNRIEELRSLCLTAKESTTSPLLFTAAPPVPPPRLTSKATGKRKNTAKPKAIVDEEKPGQLQVQDINTIEDLEKVCNAVFPADKREQQALVEEYISPSIMDATEISVVNLLESELAIALLLDDTYYSQSLLPFEVTLWLNFLSCRALETVPLSLQKHQKECELTPPTHQKKTEKVRTFGDDLSDYIHQTLIYRIEKFLAELGIHSTPSFQSYLSSLLSLTSSSTESNSLLPPPTSTEVNVRMINSRNSISPKSLLEFLKYCGKKCVRALVQAGESVGAVGAQSIGEPGTQMTLKTFHFAGVASMNVTLGVPRIKEIINAAKTITTPIIHVRLTEEHNEYLAKLVKTRIERTLLSDVCQSIKEVYTSHGAWLSVKIDLELMYNAGLCDITIEDIKNAILNNPFMSKLKLKTDHILLKGAEKLLIAPPSNERGSAYFNLRAIKAELSNVCIRGINTVRRGVVCKHEPKKEGEKVWYDIYVEGYGLRDVMGVTGVSATTTSTNHIDEINRILGIEAARTCIVREIKGCMDAYNMDINIRHMTLLADVMTCRGEVLGISRFGIAKMRGSTLLLASFEETNEHLFESAAHGRKDDVLGVSECIIMGKQVKVGTGSFGLLYNNNAPPVLSKKKTSTIIAGFRSAKP